jgi:hypothetical protein
MYWLTNKQASGVLCCFILALAACNQATESNSLYAVDSLVSKQVQYLTEAHARLKKQANVGTEGEDVTIVPKDTNEWNNELAIFRQLDQINKPVNRNDYVATNGEDDPASNLIVKSFATNEDLPVKYFKIYYQQSLNSPRKIEGLLVDSTLLSRSSKLLTMEFAQLHNKTVLTSYSIYGGQKMILGDTITYNIKGEIIID